MDRRRRPRFQEDHEDWHRFSSVFALPLIAMDDEQAVRVDVAGQEERFLAVTVGNQELNPLSDGDHRFQTFR